jgi:hypothetical protein
MIRAAALAAMGVLLLGGCANAPQLPVPLESASMKTGRIGVAMTAMPKVDTSFPGAGCLLCYAAASVANSKITDQVRTLGYEDLPKLKDEVAELIRKKGGNSVVISEDLALDKLPDYPTKGVSIASKDFTGLAQKYSIDKLVVIQVYMVGISRDYSAYFPTGDPKAVVRGRGVLVNLQTNRYEWFAPIFAQKAADKEWDEPPKFPGLTNAYYQAIEIARDAYLQPFR